MKLDIYFLAIPDEAASAAIDKWIASIAKNAEPLRLGMRIWLTHLPETATKPFLHARPFDIVTQPLKISASMREEYQVSLGASPKKHMTCCTEGDDDASFEVLVAIVLEIMKRTGRVFMSLDNDLGARMFGPGRLGDPFDVFKLESLPGAAYEVAHESDEGELSVEWFVDARWLRAWQQHKSMSRNTGETFSRFASLDYS